MTTMRIAEVAERTGVPATTLRYYEEIGLLAPAARSGNGYRKYADRDLERLAFISRAKQLEISLDELRELVEVWDDDCGEVHHRMTAMIASRIAQSQARIVDLLELTAQLQAAATRLSSAPVSDGACGDDCACVAAQATRTDPVPIPLVGDPTRSGAIPVACSLESEAARGRMAEWQTLIAKATGRRTIADGVALSFEHDVALTTEIARLAAAEFQCCSFFRFAITVDAAGVRLEIGAPPEGRDIITELFESPAAYQLDIQPPPKPTRSKASLAAVLAIVACIAACTMPLLLAGGLVAGLSALFDSWTLVGVVMLALTTGGVVIWRRRKQITGRAPAAAGEGCGCAGGGC